jgi:protoporphyrinogen/coproporphyrinogen III oxidase
MSVDVAIVGGGVSGLAAAYHLTQSGLRVIVMERQARAGGNAFSERIDGFLMEHGPSTVAGNSDEAMALSKAMGLDTNLCHLGDGIEQRYLLKDGILHGIPLGPLGFVRSGYLSIGGRLRMMAEPLLRRRPQIDGDPETVTAFCTRRFGREFTELVMDPLVGGIYAGRPDDLSIDAVFSKFAEFEQVHGSVTQGMLAARRDGKRMPGRRLMSWRDGVGSLPTALSEFLGEIVRTGATVRQIKRVGTGFSVETQSHGSLSAKSVILAAQPHVAASLLEKIDVLGAEAAGAISAPPLAVVFLGYHRSQVDHPLDSLGFLTPTSEGSALNGVQFCSTMFPNRAPDDHVAVAAYVGGARNPDLGNQPANALIDIVRNELSGLLGIHDEPVIARVRHWPRGLPQYSLGHAERAETLEHISNRVPGMFVTGNYLGGLSISDCLESAASVAGQARTYVQDREKVQREKFAI